MSFFPALPGAFFRRFRARSASRHGNTAEPASGVTLSRLGGAVVAVSIALGFQALPVMAESLAFKEAVATSSAGDEALLAFYRSHGYEGIWTGADDRRRLSAFLEALETAPLHGLPAETFSPAKVRALLRAARSQRQKGEADVAISALFADYVNALHAGIIEPRKLGKQFGQKPPRYDRGAILRAWLKSSPRAFLAAQPPRTVEYAALLKERKRLEEAIRRGGWGPKVKAGKLKPGSQGPAVVALRDRLIRMGYLEATATGVYDRKIEKAVRRFQKDHGITADGVAGKATIDLVNLSPGERLRMVLVNLERRRWINHPLGRRHVIVNIPDFRFTVFKDGDAQFSSKVVVGKPREDLQTAEFSDEMTHMVINPSWHVPPSIIKKEYLPMIASNPGKFARQGLEVRGTRGPLSVDAIQQALAEGRVPNISIRQPPGPRNALGRVKFLFPNKFNIYLHDTPSRSLFQREVRAFSHGCVRVHRPVEFAEFLLSDQSRDPAGEFRRILDSGKETDVYLKHPLPVHIVYHTVFLGPDGRINYRRDIYKRDRLVWQALEKKGVTLAPLQG